MDPFNSPPVNKDIEQEESEFTHRYPAHFESTAEPAVEVILFPGFGIRSLKEMGRPNIALEIKSGGKTFDLTSLLPPDHTLEMTFYPTGKYFHHKQHIRAPRLDTRAGIVSTAHEIRHAQRRVSLSESEKLELVEAISVLSKKGIL